MSESDEKLEIILEEIEQDEVPHGDVVLSPRYRRLAELLASGWSNAQIKEEMGYCDSRISVLKHNPLIREAIRKIQDRIYEETIAKRLKSMSDPALSEIEKCLADRSGKYKEQLKVDTAKWIVEKLDGKAIQKHDVSGGILVGLLDRLDTLKSAGGSLESLPEAIDVTPRLEAPLPDAMPVELSEEDKLMLEWAKEF